MLRKIPDRDQRLKVNLYKIYLIAKGEEHMKRAIAILVIVTLVMSAMVVLYAEAKGQANVKVGVSDEVKPNPQRQNKAKKPGLENLNKDRKGDNRDDLKSGKPDRIGDGNSGQGKGQGDTKGKGTSKEQ
jgi:hypothetical protein